MASYTPFKGIKRVLSTNTGYTQEDSFLYFVRESKQATSGDIWFMGHHYGHFGEHDLDVIKTALDGFLGPDTASTINVKDYIDEAVSAITSGMTTSVEKDPNAFSGLTIEDRSTTPNVKDYVVNLQNVAPADELAAEIDAREDADEALQAELDAVEVAVGLSSAGTHVQSSGRYTSGATTVEAEIAALDAALQNVADQTIVEGSSTEDYVKLDVATEDGVTTISINDSALTAAIEAMDLAEVHEAGKAIVAVSEEDGVVSATAGTVAAEFVDVADAGNHFDADNVEDALAELWSGYTAGDEALLGDATESGNTLGKLEDRIEELSADAKEYHLVKNEDNLPAEVKEQYYLVDADGNQSGATINIYKDSHIKSITYITDSADTHFQNLKYEYIDVCGDTKTEYVDMSALILEQEFASGITVNNAGIVHGVVDPASENFLTVGADGFKLSGVQDAINSAVSAETEAREDADDAIESALTLTAQTLVEMIENAQASATTEVVEGTDAGNNLSIAETAGADGHKIYTINLTDVASASALTQEIADREAADAAIQAELDAVESSLGFVGTGYTNTGVYISGDTVADDIKRLDTALNGVEDNFMEALEKEIEDRESGDTAIRESLAETAATLAEAIEDEASARTAADEAIDARLGKIEDEYITAVTVNGVDATVVDNAADVTIDARNIELGEDVTGTTGGVSFDASADTQDVFQKIVDVLNQSVAGSYTGVTSADKSIALTPQTNGQDIAINKQAASLTKAEEGHIFLEQDSQDGDKVFASMYWIDEETE